MNMGNDHKAMAVVMRTRGKTPRMIIPKKIHIDWSDVDFLAYATLLQSARIFLGRRAMEMGLARGLKN